MIRKNYIGIDIGGTKIAIQKYEHKDGGLYALGNIKIVETDFDNIKKTITDCIVDIKDENSVAVGIGWPGDVDRETGLVYSGVNVGNLGTQEGGFNITDSVKEAGIQKVHVINDADSQMLAAMSESKKKIKNAVVLGIGTGLGVGVLVNGDILWSSEYGYRSSNLVENPSGTTEDVISGTGLIKMLNQIEVSKKFLELKEDDVKKRLLDQATAEWKTHFATVVADIQLTYRPEITFISGGLGEKLIREDEKFIKNLIEKARQILIKKNFPRIANDLKVEEMPCDDAGTRGAAIYALQQEQSLIL